MGTITRKPGINWQVNANSQDTLQVEYEYAHDVMMSDENQAQEITEAAWAAGLPRRRQRLGTTGLFAFEFAFAQNETNRDRFKVDVTYRKPEQLGPAMAAVADLHPIYQPPRITVQYIEKELPIEKARNVEAITGGAARAANTLGYIQNGAGVVSESIPIEIERIPIIVVQRNVTSLSAIMAQNETYALTTNNASITVAGNSFAARTLKFAGADASEEQEFDNVSFWTMETRVEIHKTTDFVIDSVGTQYVNATGKMIPILQYNADDEETETEITEPIPINLDGSAGTPGTSVQITYYYLTETDYSALFS